MRKLVALSFALATCFGLRSLAFADDVTPDAACDSPLMRCSADGELSFEWQQTAFDGVNVDTGWRPTNSNVQARFAIRLEGNSHVSFDGAMHADWDSGEMRATLDAEEDAGWVSIGYGLEIAAQFRFNVSVFGQNVSWTGNIPTPINLPNDLLVAAESTYTPWLLPGSNPESVSVYDETGRISAFTIGLTNDIINVPGIGGHFALQVAASLEGEYQDESVSIERGEPIEQVGGVSVVEPDDPQEGFGGALQTEVRPRGRMRYTPGVSLYPNVRLVVLGFTVFNADLFTMHLNLPSFSSQVDFAPAQADLPLPKMRISPDVLHLGEGATEVVLSIENLGNEDLIVDAEDWPSELAGLGLSVAVEPGSSHEAIIKLSSELELSGLVAARTLSLRTNDPDSPQRTVEIKIHGPETGEPGGEGEEGEGVPAEDAAAGCGCQSTRGGASGNAILLLLVLAGVRFGGNRKRTAGA